MKQIEIKKELITPKVAERLLEHNEHNRKLASPRVLMYANDMLLGRWKQDTGETIKISPEGRLLDGQNRLNAVIKSKTPIYFHVAYNVPDDVFDVIDTGKLRNASDVFTIEKIASSTCLPSIISTYESLKIGGGNRQKNQKPTNNMLLDMYYSREKYWQSTVLKSQNWYKSFAKIIPPSLIGGMYSTFYDIDELDAENFMNQLCNGYSIENHAINLLRKKLMQDKVGVKKMTPYQKSGYIIKTWNYYRKKETIKILKFDMSKEEFPKAI